MADRCLTCGNCTMVCPTCFCSSVDDATDLAGEEAARVRRWESCFSLEHITWCPVAIDITEEAAAIRATDGRQSAHD